MFQRLLLLVLLCASSPAQSGEWRVRLGDMVLEGISVSTSTSGNTWHLGLTSESVWFMMAFPSPDGGQPKTANATRVNLTGFEPNLRCAEIGPAGILLSESALSGELLCVNPTGVLLLEGSFDM